MAGHRPDGPRETDGRSTPVHPPVDVDGPARPRALPHEAATERPGRRAGPAGRRRPGMVVNLVATHAVGYGGYGPFSTSVLASAPLLPTADHPEGHAEIVCDCCGRTFDVARRPEEEMVTEHRRNRRIARRTAAGTAVACLLSALAMIVYAVASGGGSTGGVAGLAAAQADLLPGLVVAGLALVIGPPSFWFGISRAAIDPLVLTARDDEPTGNHHARPA